MQWQICRYPWRHPQVILEMLEPHPLLWHTGGSSPTAAKCVLVHKGNMDEQRGLCLLMLTASPGCLLESVS